MQQCQKTGEIFAKFTKSDRNSIPVPALIRYPLRCDRNADWGFSPVTERALHSNSGDERSTVAEIHHCISQEIIEIGGQVVRVLIRELGDDGGDCKS
ncbi:hypothetical protein TcasGA2_TC001535 [Tribolium castaneum]|uniref:Uncharacterized protein n=1 Tax=Tribolium castaneum TaxID=7070 RepID=D7EI53_TRICA|nr:hypothetical protein TcasGA2_TC001535 [Tribolium castaneum]